MFVSYILNLIFRFRFRNVLFPVIVVQNGKDDSGPLYDLYSKHTRQFALRRSPDCSRARWQAAATVNAAKAGSVGMAYFDANGEIQLFECAETVDVATW